MAHPDHKSSLLAFPSCCPCARQLTGASREHFCPLMSDRGTPLLKPFPWLSIFFEAKAKLLTLPYKVWGLLCYSAFLLLSKFQLHCLPPSPAPPCFCCSFWTPLGHSLEASPGMFYSSKDCDLPHFHQTCGQLSLYKTESASVLVHSPGPDALRISNMLYMLYIFFHILCLS